MSIVAQGFGATNIVVFGFGEGYGVTGLPPLLLLTALLKVQINKQKTLTIPMELGCN